MAGGLTGFILGGLIAGLKREETHRSKPLQGLINSLKNAALIGFSTSLVAGMLVGLLLIISLISNEIGNGRVFNLNILILILYWAMGIGLLFGLSMGLSFGGLFAIHHIALRFILSANNSMPMNYVNFLEYASERLFLRRVAGGYIFVHRLLMEHFARM
jgi:hypothetical protein